VSAIIPAYNGEAFVADAIESVLTQTLPMSEIVVIDDGSIDGTAAVVERYASKGVRCIRQENRGPSAARNRGIAETTEELIAFLDCDDTWLPEKTALQVEYLMAHPKVGLVGGQAWWWNPQTNQRWLERGSAPNANIGRNLMIQNYVGTPSGIMIRRSALQEVGVFDPGHSWVEDWELWMRVQSRWKLAFLGQPLIVYRLVPTSLTQQNQWEHANQCFELSREFIRKFASPLWRPSLLARAWSKREHRRAVLAIQERLPRRRYLSHAWRALVSFPFDEGKAKLKHFIRALAGEAFYRIFKRRHDPPTLGSPRVCGGTNAPDVRGQRLR
jgi:glycosyltransferase involved in cell wall biosynthesis